MPKEFIPDELLQFFAPGTARRLLVILLIVLIGTIVLRLLLWLAGVMGKKRLSAQNLMLVRKGIFYAWLVLILTLVLNQLGLNLTAILGAAGIVGIAIGFAAQTSISNIISGVFLISEKSFAVGEVIKAGAVNGVVLSIDLLSVKVRTFDNQYVRIPNESLIKAELFNVTRFPIRRLDLEFTVSFETDLALLKNVCLELASRNMACLNDPEPLFLIKGFGAYGVEVLFGVWFAKDDFLTVKNSLLIEMLEHFRHEKITLAVAPALGAKM